MEEFFLICFSFSKVPMFSFCIPIQFVFGSGSFKKLSVPLAGKESFNRHYQRRLCKKIGIFRGNGETVGKIGRFFRSF